MTATRHRAWLAAAAIAWAAALTSIIAAGVYVHSRTQPILTDLVVNDPSPRTQALARRLEADRLLIEALRIHEAATTGTAAPAPRADGALVAQAVPLLEKAEQLYLAVADAETSQPGLLFYLAEVNFLMGRERQADAYLSRYWQAAGNQPLATLYGRLAKE